MSLIVVHFPLVAITGSDFIVLNFKLLSRAIASQSLNHIFHHVAILVFHTLAARDQILPDLCDHPAHSFNKFAISAVAVQNIIFHKSSNASCPIACINGNADDLYILSNIQ
jgi:hypothetical protein